MLRRSSALLALSGILLGAALSARAQTPLVRTLTSPTHQEGGRFGGAVAGVPDTDGDGRGDLLVGAYLEGVNPEGAGRVHLFSGATGALLHTLHSPHPETNGGFGLYVAGSPDLDGDGRGDLLVGTPTEDVDINGTAYNAAGRVYVFSGATGAHLYTFRSPNPEGGGAFAVPAAVPDVDHDGRADIVVGAYGEDVDAAGTAGRVYVFSSASGELLWTLHSPEPQFSGRLGAAVAGVADVDGDGVGDVLAGAWGEDVVVSGPAHRADAGRAHVFSGATGALLRTIVSPNPERLGYFGSALAAVADTDGDDVEDFLISALREDVPGTNDAGRVHLFSGATGALLHTLVSPDPMVTGNFGEQVAGVPDADGDGRGDLLVGAYPEGAYAGRAYLFSGATGVLLATITSPNPADGGFFGEGVAGVPDTDGDGRGDALVGAPHETEDGLSRAGRAYLFTGFVTTNVISPSEVAPFGLVVTPNPAREQAAIRFTLDQPGPVRLALYDALGREVAVLASGTHAAGEHTVALETRDRAPGVYAVHLVAGNARATKLLSVVR